MIFCIPQIALVAIGDEGETCEVCELSPLDVLALLAGIEPRGPREWRDDPAPADGWPETVAMHYARH